MSAKVPVVVGVDVAASRPSVAVALGVERKTIEIVGWREADEREAGDRERLFDWIDAVAPVAVGFAAAQRPRREGKGAGPRLAEAELLRRRIAVTPVPTRARAEAGGPRAAHVRAGWAYFKEARRRGYEAPALGALSGALGQAAAALEIYPHAGFVTLLGGTPPAKSTREGAHVRLLTLRGLGVRWDEYYDPASIDALMAAFTAWRFVQGVATSLGDERDGRIWLPVAPHELQATYGPLTGAAARTAAGRLALR